MKRRMGDQWLAGTSLRFTFLLLLWPVTLLANGLPRITSMPTINTNPVVTDATTHYTVTLTALDPDGYEDLRDMRVLFNVTEANGDPSFGRGYLAWGQSDSDITRYGGTWTLADATGGGRWGYRTDAWGGTTYIAPLGCTVSTGGGASGSEGDREVAWVFAAKPGWEWNPLTNDADAFIADYAVNTGWMDNPVDFDVVAGECVTWSPMPRAPVVSGSTATTLDVAIDSRDSATDLYAIRVSPNAGTGIYVQQDGSVGPAAQWQTKDAWSQTTVTGLMWNTTYSFAVRAASSGSGNCPSDWGPASEGVTESYVPLIEFEQGMPFSPAVRGQCPYRSITADGVEVVWDLAMDASGRGLAGGLDADTYDWRDVNSGANWGLRGGYFTTLQFLQFSRDHDSIPLLTANMFGGGYQDPSDGTFICQTDNPDGLAADWVRYTNIILQNYRQGEEGSLAGEDLRVYDSIVDWSGRPRLLAVDEPATAPVRYWEIGNEPEVGGIGTFLSQHYLGPNDYRDRYRMMSQAMLAVDGSLQIGPCLTDVANANGGALWLNALADDADAPIDFVAYHPYYSSIKYAWGNPAAMTDALRAYKAFLLSKSAAVRSILANHGRSGVKLMATEWNPLNWDASSQQQRSMSMGLSIVEGVFTFAEDDVFAAHFWEQPQNKLSARDVFDGLRDDMGDTLVSHVQSMGLDPGNINWRIYVSKSSDRNNQLMIWGLNFNEDEVVEVDLSLAPSRVESAVLRRYGIPGDDASGGDTSLMHSSGMAWEESQVTEPIDTSGFSFLMEDAEVTLLVLDVVPLAWADLDRDGDVDQVDFGRFQACLTGTAVPQEDPACRYAHLDADTDVDRDDFTLFYDCMTSPGMPADPDCAK